MFAQRDSGRVCDLVAVGARVGKLDAAEMAAVSSEESHVYVANAAFNCVQIDSTAPMLSENGGC